jgi:hypothetical protein
MVVEASMVKIINRQFEMIGEKIRFEDIPDDELITVGRKKIYWYNHFKFTEEQEKEWVKWMRNTIKGTSLHNRGDFIELRYGFIRG